MSSKVQREIYSSKEKLPDVSLINQHFPRSQPPSKEDINVIQNRQLAHPVYNVLAVEGEKEQGGRCKYGFSRAFVMYPCGGDKVSSGMIRLACPHLVKFVDTLECDGGIQEVNDLLATDEELRKNYKLTNDAWRNIKADAISKEEEELVETSLGKQGRHFLMTSGLIGTTSEADAKCLHAHIADNLLRGNNKIGEWALKKLSDKYGVDVRGCDDCHQQCDLAFQPTNETWWYTPKKNKQKLRTKRLRRIQHREFVKSKELQS